MPDPTTLPATHTRRPRPRRPWIERIPSVYCDRTIAGTQCRLRLVDDPAACGLHYAGDYADIIRRETGEDPDHTYWTYRGQTLWGVVYRLPYRAGYISGLARGWDRDFGKDGPAELAIWHPPTRSIIEAAHYADRIASWDVHADHERDVAEDQGSTAKRAHEHALEERYYLLDYLRRMQAIRRAVSPERASAISVDMREDVRTYLTRIRESRQLRDHLLRTRPTRDDLRAAWDWGYKHA